MFEGKEAWNSSDVYKMMRIHLNRQNAISADF